MFVLTERMLLLLRPANLLSSRLFKERKHSGGAALNIGSSRPSPEVPAPDTSNQEMMRMTVQNAHNEAQVIELRMRAAPLEVGLLTHKVKLRYVYLAIMSTNIYQTHCT